MEEYLIYICVASIALIALVQTVRVYLLHKIIDSMRKGEGECHRCKITRDQEKAELAAFGLI